MHTLGNRGLALSGTGVALAENENKVTANETTWKYIVVDGTDWD
jgi:hypothetical protein